MGRYAERPFWRCDGDGAPATSSMVDAICGYVKRFQALDGDAKAWALDVYGQRDAMADFLFQVNKLELEGFDTRDQTLHALEQLHEVVAPDERLEQVRCLSRAFNAWWLQEEKAEEAPSVNNYKLRQSHELLMEPSRPEIAGLFRSGSEVAMTITSSGRQHFYADAWAIRPKLSKLRGCVPQCLVRCWRWPPARVCRPGLKCFESAREDDHEPRDLTALIIEGVYFGWQRFFVALESWQGLKL
ncbi:hypothetical protein SELMODRAFT_427919 [Selaginella moellendorffii]|uniref:Uncharacterized protein n=1 Tax=Selaginella moellendorffii TaxID=88036 RepID=D8T145_SELML|nr:hypothetical protein SELMODRAFT_427919 [Selaginella moellendorffii]